MIHIVWSPTGEAPAKVTHGSHKEAFAIAHLMARRNPGQQFYVMRSASREIVHAAPVPAELDPADGA